MCYVMLIVKDVALRKRPSKLGRQGAVRKRKDEVREIQGHKFLPQKFFQIMCCALCTELFTGKGAQCEGRLPRLWQAFAVEDLIVLWSEVLTS